MSDSFYTEYQYANGSTAHSTSNLISGVTQKLGEDSIVSYSYEYNDNEDVEYILEDGERVACYTYGDMNQLSYYADENTGIYKHFYYDNVGNITGVTDYRLLSYGWIPGSEIESHTYTYGDNNWKDKLTKYDNQTITYDENGNPLQYRDGMSFTWINGRILDTVSVDNDTIEMQYDYNGMRTQKGDTQYYYDSENRLIGMTKGSHTLLFYYDENGNPTAFTDNGTMYFYIRNLQGDIVKIVNSSGAVVINYIYDALGKKLSVKDASDNEITDLNSLALLNPLRYLGYVYDDETGLYYLQSRYYDPTIGRFINADNYFDTNSGTPLSINMFAYCENNCIQNADYNGCASIPSYNTTFRNRAPINLINKYLMSMTLYAFSISGKAKYNNMYDITSLFANRIKKSSTYLSFFNESIKGLNFAKLFDSMIHTNRFSYYILEIDKDGNQHGKDNRNNKLKRPDFKNEGNLSDLNLAIGGIRGVEILLRFNGPSKLLVGGKRLRNFYLTVRLYDRYDFDILDKSNSIAKTIVNLINNIFGYLPQKHGLLTNYYWKVEFNYSYQYVCPHGS